MIITKVQTLILKYRKLIFYFSPLFSNMGPHGGDNCKMLLLLEFNPELFQVSPEFSSQWYS